MAYATKITRDNPTALLFLLDQSGSMKEYLGKDTGKRKSDSAAEAINQIIRGFVLQSTKSWGVADYFYIGVIGYAERAVSILGGPLRDLELVPISKIRDHPLRIEERIRVEKIDDGAGGLIEHTVTQRHPIWVEPVADGSTAMCRALDYAYTIISDWVASHPNCFPPIVINISDGEPKDGNPTSRADKIRALSTTDGNVMIFNFHISSKPKGEILFPSKIPNILDRHASLLFNMSSQLTENMIERASHNSLQAVKGSRGFGYCVNNSDMLVKLMEIGSTTTGTG